MYLHPAYKICFLVFNLFSKLDCKLELNHSVKRTADGYEKDLVDFFNSISIVDETAYVTQPKSWFGSYFYKILLPLRGIKSYPGAWFGFPKRLTEKDGKFKRSVLIDLSDKEYKLYNSLCLEKACSFYNLGVAMASAKFWSIVIDDDLSLLYRYAKCYRNEKIGEDFFNCPNPCNSVPCAKIQNAKPFSCKSYYDSAMILPMNQNFNEKFRKIFNYRHICSCINGYRWQNGNCVHDQQACMDSSHVCANGGRCEINNKNETYCKIFLLNFLFYLKTQV
jgi:hypothetical protein